jgi:hypothetical protein
MKKMTVFTLLVAVLILGACSKQGAGSVENSNNLVYKVNGKTKSVAAETKSDYKIEFKVPEGFNYLPDKNFFIIGGKEEDNLFGVNISVNTKGIVESHNENVYKRVMSLDGAKNITKIDDEFFQSHYDFYFEADDKKGGHMYTLAKKIDNRVYAIGANIPGNKLNDETKAEVIAILKSIKL